MNLLIFVGGEQVVLTGRLQTEPNAVANSVANLLLNFFGGRHWPRLWWNGAYLNLKLFYMSFLALNGTFPVRGSRSSALRTVAVVHSTAA